jgi:hypothetical protein
LDKTFAGVGRQGWPKLGHRMTLSAAGARPSSVYVKTAIVRLEDIDRMPGGRQGRCCPAVWIMAAAPENRGSGLNDGSVMSRSTITLTEMLNRDRNLLANQASQSRTAALRHVNADWTIGYIHRAAREIIPSEPSSQ